MTFDPPGRRRGGTVPTSPHRRRRHVTPDERRLWQEVMRTATPLRPEPNAEPNAAPVADTPREAAPAPKVRPAPPPPEGVKPRRSQAPRLVESPGPRRGVAPASAAEGQRPASDPKPVGRPEPGLDRNTARRLGKGERAPDARIDLHGMTAQRAHAALDRFMGEAVAAGHRCVLVITGKGGRHDSGEEAPWMRRRHGVLREEAPRWLSHGRHARNVVGVYQAHARHGGGGAFYVYLKKTR